MSEKELKLRYGCNPHQTYAGVRYKSGRIPLTILNGKPSYINLLDALNSWQLVRELRQVLNLPAAASFKHVSPAGAAVSVPLNDPLRKACFVDDMELSPLSVAYARARGADRLSSFGDWAALSDPLDVSTAKLLRRETSDGLITPAGDPEAYEILKKKKQGNYIIIQIDPNYEPEEIEIREVFGITLVQKRNNLVTGSKTLKNVVTRNKFIPENAVRDLQVANIVLKYTQSNSICFAKDGQVIGLGAGQQNRLACTKLAATKAETWYLRQHPDVLNFKFQKDKTRPERINAIELFLNEEMTPEENKVWKENFKNIPEAIGLEARKEWLSNLKNVSLSSDAFIPFRDNIDRAARTGVKFVLQSGGSIQDKNVIDAANEYGMAMVFSGVRLFHH